ncbi:MAG TPA: ATP-grasp domain-containing protein, partial [Planctomycetaceae bacterium]|nr:ATP-grasp domain-containing protein [Planctomycetaceae bacterium]
MSIRQQINTDSRPRLLITGASTRAAAWSALRAGFLPVCADRFADEDLWQVAEVHSYAKVERERRTGRPTFVASARLAVTDGVCDHEEQFRRRDEPRQLRNLLGPVLGQNRFWRSDFRGLAKPLENAGLPFLAEREGTFARLVRIVGSTWTWSPPPNDKTWIEKPIWGGGGRGIRIWDAAAASGESFREESYFQEYRDGQPMSAIFLADKNQSPKVQI